ncbi:MAG: 2-dehydro-3-deoxygalactonokinase [Janthinobacterium lividum]
MIGIDWGTTSFRAVRLQGQAVIDRRDLPLGILRVPPGGFASALHDAVAPWLAAGETRILVSGMAGSRQGWQEAPYLPCPADAAALAAALKPVPFDAAQVFLVPGLSVPGDPPEVMRGEETQLVGTLASIGRDGLACLPGSHSKWARIVGGSIAGFSTHLTGEAFAALRDHTILGRMVQPGAEPDPACFDMGVARSAQPGGLLHHLFGVRTLGLFDRLPNPESYLSGLLIGHEIHAAAPGSQTVHLIGEPKLCALYARAIAGCGSSAIIVTEDAAAAGLALIGEHAAWT